MKLHALYIWILCNMNMEVPGNICYGRDTEDKWDEWSGQVYDAREKRRELPVLEVSLLEGDSIVRSDCTDRSVC